MSRTDLHELYHLLHRLNRQMNRTSHREGYGKDRVHQGQANLLLAVLQNDGSSQRDLAEQLDVRPSSMTEMLTKLEQSNLIVRKQDDKDQRVMHIYLTEEGKKIAEEIAEKKVSFAESFFQALTEDEQGQLLTLVKKICNDLEVADHCHADEMSHKHDLFHHIEHHHCTHHGNGFFHKHGHHGNLYQKNKEQ